MEELAKLLIEVNGSGNYFVREFPPERKGIDIGDYYSDFNLIKTRLGWAPKVSLPEALRRIVEYYRNNLREYI